MITKRRYKQIQETYLSMAVLFAAGIFSIITLSNAPQIHALEGTSTQTSCIDNQPCHTMVCSEGQPCKASETPNTDFDADENTLTPPSEDETIQQPLEGTGTMGQAPSPDAYNNDYREDQEEERQDMIEDAEYD
jgi:hypothetical protein